ncbi:hypothetical protein [Burkholderia cenocepacia]|uniref:hypothetical protein n=1 Tax=Burkholderia cenocepacia TaxID=95486 RepID=UPI00285F9F49|nr:hypothetical protein [Burkholderia cenocepacia]MDR5660983.1 hypothetical protein [Burkholderia cenocepacia]MDR8094141.1 hypothetical protein [Burkholderia cenocepacia]
MTKREIDRSGDSFSPDAKSCPMNVGELTILLDPRLGGASYFGTRAQIEAEGMVPATIEWPKGFDVVRWAAGDNEFWLRRDRPEGAKGPRRDFLSCDNWRLGILRRNWSPFDHQIMRKTEELRKMLHRDSRAGRAAFSKFWAALQVATEDQKFQAFKALVPGLVPEPRTRRGGRPAQARNIEQ